MIGKQINIFGEEDDFNVKSKEQRLGLSYQGSKRRIADIIVQLLPSGNRFVDLFGGGGSVTHCAILYNKWNKYLYNDYDKIVYEYFKKAINGEYKNETRVITREDFKRLKDVDPYVRFCWSFGNKGNDYLWSKEKEETKLIACRMIMENDWHERFKYYRQFVNKVIRGEHDDKMQLHGLEALQRLQSLERLERIQKFKSESIIQCTNMSYQDYEYQDGDVVYCDPPYEDKEEYRNTEFDHKAFYEWVKTRPYQVWFSSYEISDDSFYKLKLKTVSKILCASGNSDKSNEYLYSNKKI